MNPGRRSESTASRDPLFLDRPTPVFPARNSRGSESRASEGSDRASAELLRQRLAVAHRLPLRSIRFVGNIDEARAQIVSAAGPVVVFPPSASATEITAIAGVDVLPVAKGWGRDEVVDASTAADIPSTAIAWIESPSDPLGSAAPMADMVRLARSCHAVIVDERLSLTGGQSLQPLAAEFDNVVILRSLAGWPDLSPVWWWTAGSARALARLDFKESIPRGAATRTLHAYLTGTDMPAVNSMVRAERSRLFRMLRKFSFVTPVPSWAPFVAARIDLMPRARFLDELAARGIYVHAPAQPGLEQYVRIGVGPRSATERLLAALRDMAPGVLG